jgi:hypothetical protein
MTTIRHRRIVSLLLAAMAALCSTGTARPSIIVATITGTVANGTDLTGLFAPANSDLSGLPFRVTYTFDDTQGTQTTQTCFSGGPGYYSGIATNGASNPGTAMLQIGGTSFQIGGGGSGQSSINSYALRYIANSCFSYSAAGFGVQASYVGQTAASYNGTAYVGYFSGPSLYPIAGTEISNDYDWRSSITSATLNPNDTLPFNVNVTSGYPLSTQLYYASGNLSPTQLTISGLNPGGTVPEPRSAVLILAAFAAIGICRIWRTEA